MTLTLKTHNIAIGAGQPLFCLLGLNVLEDMDLALTTAAELKNVTSDLNVPFVFKASFDKANRSSIKSFRGPGLKDGLKILDKVKEQYDVPIVTDVHELGQSEEVAKVADILQIPAFLCRQTDLVREAAEAAQKNKGLLHIKKAQFLAPWDCKNIVSKVKEIVGEDIVILCERGTSFGYNNLIVDMLAIPEMKALGCPVTIDATHAAQLPGADPRTQGASAGGRRDGVPTLAMSAIAAGADGVFLEFHPDPDQAKCDALCCLPLCDAGPLLKKLKDMHALVNASQAQVSARQVA